MTFPIIPASTVSGDYRISRSLRFRSSASAYLSRTPTAAGNQKTWTWSGWVKRGALGGNATLFYAGPYTSTAFANFRLRFQSDSLVAFNYDSSYTLNVISTAIYRDPSAWYHIVAVVDTTSATTTITGGSTDRVRLYVNGVQLSSFSTATVPTQSSNTQVNTTNAHYVGNDADNYYFDGYLAEVNFIDGQALTPSSFGQNDATTGVWTPKAYTGTYGTNGFYLKYADPSGSGNGNDTYTKLLLHGNGLNDSAWNGSSNHALTAYGSATTSATQTKFGMSSSLYTLGSSSQYFRTDASADFKYAAASGSTNDFTFDFWFYPGASGTQSPVIGIADTTYSSMLIYSTQLYASSNNTGWDVATGQSLGSPTLGQWNHYAIVRSGSTWYTFLNGVQQATWTNSTAGYDYTTNNFIQIGRAQGGSLYSTGYYAEVRWSAGIARWTSAFTPPTVPYSGGAGTDSSGSVNAWRPFNINTSSSGTTYDSMIDSPTNYADGGNGRGNYCVLNPLSQSGATLSRANLREDAATAAAVFGTMALDGKFYFEDTVTFSVAGFSYFGVALTTISPTAPTTLAGVPSGYWIWRDDAYMTNAGTSSVLGTAISTGQIGMVAYDQTTGKLWFGAQGTWFGSGDPAAGANPSYTLTAGTSVFPLVGSQGSTGATIHDANFGQRPFTYTPPSGFKALNTQNLPTPTIAAGNAHFDALTYTGSGSTTRSITGLSFAPDLVWHKARSAADDHRLVDVVRAGGTNLSSKILFPNLTLAEDTTASGYLTQTSVGYDLGVAASPLNVSSRTYVSWNWKAAGTVSANNNTSGSITSTVSANVSAGFSVVTYTGNGTAGATVGHGLGVAPSMIIVKRRDASAAWDVYHSSIGNTGRLYLNTTDATNTSSAPWNNTSPISTVFSLGTATDTNNNGSTIVAYCFAPVAGYSAFGSYTGNGSTDGPFVYTGFRPRWLLLKNTADGTTSWVIYDTSRTTYNIGDQRLCSDLPNAESTVALAAMDILSNGFKIRTSGGLNGSTQTIIYAAFAENPFRIARAR